MKPRTRGATAVSVVVGLSVCVWVFWAHGLPAAAATVLATLAGGLGLAWAGERRQSAGLARKLELESARARDVSDHAWQRALLEQVVDEIHAEPDEISVLQTATTALGRTLEPSRAIAYGRDGDGVFRARAQFASDGVTPLPAGAALPAVLAADRELAERLGTSSLTEDTEPELRALGARLQARSVVVVPVGEDHRLALLQCDWPRQWTRIERGFIRRFADQLAVALARAGERRRHDRDAEARDGLVRVAHALSGARETRAVLDIATSVGSVVARARSSAVVVDDAADGFRLARQHGFEPEITGADVRVLESALEDCLRLRRTGRVDPRERAAGRRALTSLGPLALVPLFYGREALGVFVLAKAPGDPSWPEDDIRIAESLSELTASALKNASVFEALTSAEARYADLFDNAADLYQTLDPGGRILDCNLTQCQTLGVSKEDLMGRRFTSFVTRESLGAWRSVETELVERGRVREAAVKLRARDGRSVDVLVNAWVVPASGDGPRSARVVMRDVTEQKRLEQQLRQRQKLEIVGALAGGIAHDFNNVLGGILGYASLLEAQLRDRPRALKFVDTIERSAVRGAELAGRLLAASRKTPARREAVNVNEVVEETLELLAHTFDKRVRIEKRLDARVRSILADAGQLQQVVLNLCVNARDAMPDGGALRVETEVDESDHRLRLSVEDTGVGMEPATMERLFEPFFSTKGEGGSGLGLSVVYGIVKALGGDVRVKSSPGKGARFDIFVPTKWVAAREPLPDRVEPARGRGELVLLVDDERVLRELGKEILEGHGYRVEAVESGEEALAFIRESGESVSLVILDLVMPGIDGGETFRRLRDVNDEIPVLLSSGLSSEDAVEEILDEGASGFIPKPYGINELTQAVSLAIGDEDTGLMH